VEFRFVFGVYKIFFYYEAAVHESIIFLSPPPACFPHTFAIRSHAYCAIYATPDPPPSTAIHHTTLAMAISCKGQVVFVVAPLKGRILLLPLYGV